jgi:glycosyltransferase involved in cell wall biosynthesis
MVTNLMSLSDFRAVTGFGCPPALLYFHENQMTYPLAPGESMDYQFGFTDITSALSARRVLFNSKTHFEAFFQGLTPFLKMMPEYRPNWVIAEIRRKSGVLYAGCRFPSGSDGSLFDATQSGLPPLIIWNHRWEFDKSPGDFFRALDAVLERGLDFRLALLGENFQTAPKEFLAARERYGRRIVQYGYVESKQEYQDWLKRGTVVISTARQENFGISVIEAIRFGCFPLLPRRLVYPEILPESFHGLCLYEDHEDLVLKLTRVLTDPSSFRDMIPPLSEAMGRFAWENLMGPWDDELARLGKQPDDQGPEKTI